MTAKNSNNDPQPIDAVITWVDGADSEHKAKLDKYLASIGGERPRAAIPSRFYCSGEINYCVTSLLRFAPWIRTIFIVTDAQAPALIHKLKGTRYEHKVKVIDHKTIFCDYERHLPTFNSSSISALLWRIPGLAENFIFLNDDFALLRTVNPSDFFRDNKVILRGSWRKYASLKLKYRVKSWFKKFIFRKKSDVNQQRFSYLAGQELSAKYLHFETAYFQVPHNPHPWRCSTFKTFFNDNPQPFELSIGYRLRSAKQFVIEALAAHLELKHGTASIDNRLKTLQLKPADQSLMRIRRKLGKADIDQDIAFVCIQNIENAPAETQKLIFSWLDSRIGSLEDFLNDQP
jgi:hypothetical protein